MARMSLKQQWARALRGVAWRIDRPPKSRRGQPAPPQGTGALIRDSAPGCRAASWFVEQFPRFYVTSSTGLTTARLNLRYEAIVGQNRDIFAGASVLDLASHDGRWSLAALAAGARSVTGIEARPELVNGAAKNLSQYGYGADRARFVTGDGHQVLTAQEFDADVVLCLGFLSHTLRYNELLHGIRRTGARYLTIDTFSPHMMAPVPNVNVITEYADQEGAAAADTYTCGPSVLVGRPNLAAIRVMLGVRLPGRAALRLGRPAARQPRNRRLRRLRRPEAITAAAPARRQRSPSGGVVLASDADAPPGPPCTARRTTRSGAVSATVLTPRSPTITAARRALSTVLAVRLAGGRPPPRKSQTKSQRRPTSGDTQRRRATVKPGQVPTERH